MYERVKTGRHETRVCVCAGLFGEYVRQAGVARPSPYLHANPPQDHPGTTGRGKLGQNLDTGHVFPQREASHVSRGDRQQPATAPQRHRLPVVRHQVSHAPYMHLMHCSQWRF